MTAERNERCWMW